MQTLSRGWLIVALLFVAACAKRPAAESTEQIAQVHPGEAVYASACAECHEGGVPKAPHKMFLQMMAADAILTSLDEGIMRMQAAQLGPAERRAVAEYLSGHSLDEAVAGATAPACEGPAAEFDLSRPPAKAGWGVSREKSTTTLLPR